MHVQAVRLIWTRTHRLSVQRVLLVRITVMVVQCAMTVLLEQLI